jgi:hypothetical protein
MGFNLDDYEPVAARLDRWLKDHPNAIVRTEMLSTPGADICVMAAELWLDGQCVSMGHAEEVRGTGNVNRTSHVENCETSAIGRALANAGYAGSDMTKRPSREEMAKVARHTPNPIKGVRPDLTAVRNVDDPVTVKGTQHGDLPEWLLNEAFKEGITQVWDNRDKVAGTKRPWFKDVNGDKAFWPPRGTPDPVITTTEQVWDTEEESF